MSVPLKILLRMESQLLPLLNNFFNAKGMFHIVLCALCCECVGAVPVLSLDHARENTKHVIIYPFSSKIHILNPILCSNKKVNMCQYPDIFLCSFE